MTLSDFHETPVHLAARHGHADVCKLLLESRAEEFPINEVCSRLCLSCTQSGELTVILTDTSNCFVCLCAERHGSTTHRCTPGLHGRSQRRTCRASCEWRRYASVCLNGLNSRVAASHRDCRVCDAAWTHACVLWLFCALLQTLKQSTTLVERRLPMRVTAFQSYVRNLKCMHSLGAFVPTSPGFWFAVCWQPCIELLLRRNALAVDRRGRDGRTPREIIVSKDRRGAEVQYVVEPIDSDGLCICLKTQR